MAGCLILSVNQVGAQTSASNVSTPTVQVRVEKRAQFPISPRLFGQFMELPGTNELGPDAALVTGKKQLRPEVVTKIRELAPPLLRYPAGARVSFGDWREFLDKAPGKDKPLRGQVRFTLDPFLKLCRELGAEPLLVVNCRLSIIGEKSPLEDAKLAAQLVAYCNAPSPGNLPPDLQKWADARRANGFPKPWGVRYWQIGNEIWIYGGKKGTDDEATHHATVIGEFVRQMRAVNRAVRGPNLVLISDAMNPRINAAIRRKVGNGLDFLSEHRYVPWEINEVKRGETKLRASDLTLKETWNAWVGVPDMDAMGRSVLRLHHASQTTYPVAVTEWNWNGWVGDAGEGPLESLWAKGVGAAGFLHAMLRGGQKFPLATQSMLVGNSWQITGIRVSPDDKFAPYLMPTTVMTGFYRHRVRGHFLPVHTVNAPFEPQPFQIGGIAPKDRVTALDVVASADAKALGVHFINRSFDKALPISLDLSQFGDLSRRGDLEILSGSLKDSDERAKVQKRLQSIAVSNGRAVFSLPPRVVACFTVGRKSD